MAMLGNSAPGYSRRYRRTYLLTVYTELENLVQQKQRIYPFFKGTYSLVE